MVKHVFNELGEECKRCVDCGEVKPLLYYSMDNRSLDKLSIYCKVCTLKRVNKYIESNLLRSWCQRTIAGHRYRGKIININPVQLEKMIREGSQECYICGIPLKWEERKGTSGQDPSSPTLDMIDNGELLDYSTIALCCNRCNATKQDRSFDEFIRYMIEVLKGNGYEILRRF